MRMQTYRKVWLGMVAAVAAVGLVGPARAAELDKLLPGDAEVVAVVNIRQILDSALVKKYALEQAKAALAANPQAQQVIKATGLDPLKDIERVIATNAGGVTGKTLILIKGNYQPEKIHATITEVAKTNTNIKLHKEGIFQVYEAKGEQGEPLFLAFANNQTLVGSPSKEYLLNILQGKVKAEKKPLQPILEKLTCKESVCVAAVVTPDMQNSIAAVNPQFKDLAGKLTAVTGTIDLTNAITGTVNVHTSDAMAAAQVRMMVQGFLPLLKVFANGQEQLAPFVKDIFDNIKVNSNKEVATVSIKISDELIQKIIKAAGGQLPQKP
jgi:hypothetical protein